MKYIKEFEGFFGHERKNYGQFHWYDGREYDRCHHSGYQTARRGISLTWRYTQCAIQDIHGPTANPTEALVPRTSIW